MNAATMIDLDKVQTALQKIVSEPEHLAGIQQELAKFFESLSPELSWAEKSYLLAQLTVVGAAGVPEDLPEAIPASKPKGGAWDMEPAIPASKPKTPVKTWAIPAS